MRRMGGFVLMITGVLVCPCFLIVALPLVVGLVAGTALGSFLTQQTGLVYTGMGIYFIAATGLGYWFLFGPNRPKRNTDAVCSTCGPAVSDEQSHEQVPLPEDLPAPMRQDLR